MSQSSIEHHVHVKSRVQFMTVKDHVQARTCHHHRQMPGSVHRDISEAKPEVACLALPCAVLSPNS